MERVKRIRGWVFTAALAAVFVYLVSNMELWRIGLSLLFPQESEVIYPRAQLLQLLREHLVLVLASSFTASITGITVGVFATRPAGRDYLYIINDLSSLAQTVPPVAVLALAVPFMGFGFKPTVLALFLYSILPVLRNTISGIESVSPKLIEAASGIGMKRFQILLYVELPLSIKVIMAGIRTSVVINVGTATAGAVVGAGGLGAPIISGLVRENPAFVLEGAIAAALLAITFDQVLAQVETTLFKGYGTE